LPANSAISPAGVNFSSRPEPLRYHGERMMIAVIGGDASPGDALEQAETVGREIGRRGHTLVCGGRGGVMEAACRGARAEGGHTVGILPGLDRADVNSHVEFPIVTNMGAARNTIVVLSADAVIAIDGAYGTLSEIAMALIHGRPVVGLGTWRLERPGGVADAGVVHVEDPVEAVQRAEALGQGHVDAAHERAEARKAPW
jgi:uncharacterized protein (TIGR00725 family)